MSALDKALAQSYEDYLSDTPDQHGLPDGLTNLQYVMLQQLTQPEVSVTETEHVILVAVHVKAGTREQAHRDVAEFLNASRLGPLSGHPFGRIEEWWIAEDDRIDGSDNDSAVFCHPGQQNKASRYLHHLGYSNEGNVVERKGGQFA